MRMLVFPYSHDCEPIIRHAGMLMPCYEIVALVSPGGWGLAGKKVTMGDSGVVLPIYEKVQEVTEEFDSLFIPAFEVFDEEVEDRLTDEMVRLIPHLLNVVCAAHFSDKNRKKLGDACRCSNPSCTFLYFLENRRPEEYGLTLPDEEYPPLQAINVPAVIVAGAWEKTDKFEISLALRERFLKNGYSVSQVGSREGCEMFGFHSFPGFMFRKDVDIIDKIIYFNRWIVRLTEEEQSDLVMISIPGAMQNFNEQFTRGFGMLHHQVFQAITPDALVVCTFYMPNITEDVGDMSTFCKYRFGAPVDAFHMSNLLVDLNDSEESNRIVTNSIYRKDVSEAVAKGAAISPIPIFNGLDSTDCNRMFEVILEKLTPKEVQAVL